MAKQIHYRPEQYSFQQGPDADPTSDIDEELAHLKSRLSEVNTLLDQLHDSGVLRWLNELLGSLPQVSTVAVTALNNEQGRTGIRNLLAIVWQLGRYDPTTVEKALDAIYNGVEQAGQTAAGEHDSPYAPPGVTGLFKLLRDEQLWQSLAPLIEGARAFSRSQQADQQSQEDSDNQSQQDTGQ